MTVDLKEGSISVSFVVVRDRCNTGMNEVKMSSWVIFWFSATPNIREAACGNLF
jgi:hypothetical protein